jgi:hypothetical protein
MARCAAAAAAAAAAAVEQQLPTRAGLHMLVCFHFTAA